MTCKEPYIREEALAEQIRTAIAKVALPDPGYQQVMAAWAEEREKELQPLAKLKIELAEKAPEIQAKLDRLLDTHLDGVVGKAEYLAKKESLLKVKIDLEERLKKLEQEASGWLEPCREFIEAAHQAHRVAAGGNLESHKEMLKKIGSNFRLAAKTLNFQHAEPWRTVERRAGTAPGDFLWS